MGGGGGREDGGMREGERREGGGRDGRGRSEGRRRKPVMNFKVCWDTRR